MIETMSYSPKKRRRVCVLSVAKRTAQCGFPHPKLRGKATFYPPALQRAG